MKVDLYEIDYEDLWLWNQISVKQKYKYIFNWYNSESPAETNPRAFVWDKDDKFLYLPITIKWESRSRTKKTESFPWLKVLEIKIDSGIKEVFSNNLNHPATIIILKEHKSD